MTGRARRRVLSAVVLVSLPSGLAALVAGVSPGAEVDGSLPALVVLALVLVWPLGGLVWGPARLGGPAGRIVSGPEGSSGRCAAGRPGAGGRAGAAGEARPGPAALKSAVGSTWGPADGVLTSRTASPAVAVPSSSCWRDGGRTPCACGCGRWVDPDGPSPWFAGEGCQHPWQERLVLASPAALAAAEALVRLAQRESSDGGS